MRVGFLVLAVILISCSKTKKSTDETRTSLKESVQLGGYKYEIERTSAVSSATIASFSYDAPSHSINLSLDYHGCGETKHSILYSDICAESYPSQCGAAILHSSNYDTSCVDPHHEDVVFPLKENQNEMVLFVANKEGKGLSALVDRDGKVKAATTPP